MSTRLEYLGHSCFLLTADNGWKGVFDPYADGSVPGLKLPEITADDVFVSHGHSDHNAAELVKSHKQLKPCPYDIAILKTDHDDRHGALRGSNDITILTSAHEKIIHCGDLGRMLTQEEVHAMAEADVVMIPCGGYYTIDAAAAGRILEQIRPKLTVLMHYRRGPVGYEVLAALEEVGKFLPEVQILNQSEIEVGTITGVIALNPKQ